MHSPSQKEQSQEEALNEYISAVLEREKQEFTPGVESFTVHANKIRQEISDAAHAFQKAFNSGYQELLNELAQMHPQTDSDADPLAIYRIEEGLGFSLDAMQGFYEAAHKLYEQNRFSEARDSFFFLATVAPQVHEFWL